ncbi:hypothetical protein ACHWQZ_G005792 [Mnemiopsis leidyi]
MSSRRSLSGSESGYRREVRSAMGHHEALTGDDTSLFGSPVIPDRPHSSFSYRGPQRRSNFIYSESAMSLLSSSRPSTSMSFSEKVLEEADRTISRLSERTTTELEEDIETECDLTPTGERPSSSFSVTSLVVQDLEDQLDDKYLEYRRRHFTEEGERRLEARKNRLPEYEHDLMDKYQRSFVRQADLMFVPDGPVKRFTVKRSDSNPLPGEQVWDHFPTVEDLDGCYLVERQFELAVDPRSDNPHLPEWMGLYHGEDGVYTLNKGLSHMPITGKSRANQVERIRDGVKVIHVYRPCEFSLQIPKEETSHEFGFKITIMDNGVYVTHIESEGAAVRAGLKYGDQILRIGQDYCSGMLLSQVEKLISSSGDELALFVRDRPNEKMYTLLRDSSGHFGFRIRSAEIIEVIPGTSASRNGIPTNHFVTEVNGQNVLGWNDDQIRERMDISAADGAVTITLLHERAYRDFIKDLGAALFATMDHSMNFSLPLPKVNVDSVFWNPTAVLHKVTEKTSTEN